LSFYFFPRTPMRVVYHYIKKNWVHTIHSGSTLTLMLYQHPLKQNLWRPISPKPMGVATSRGLSLSHWPALKSSSPQQLVTQYCPFKFSMHLYLYLYLYLSFSMHIFSSLLNWFVCPKTKWQVNQDIRVSVFCGDSLVVAPSAWVSEVTVVHIPWICLA
jgi:hypothetical protein